MIIPNQFKHIFIHLLVLSSLGFFYSTDSFGAPVLPPDAAAGATQPIASSPKSIITMTSGLYTGNAMNFKTGMACPINFIPYVTISSAKTGVSANAFGGKKVCVSSLTPSANDLTVNFQSTTSVKTIKNVTMGNGGTDARYVSNNSDAWTIWDAEDFPPNHTISANSVTQNTTGDIYWIMYCYPPTLTPPPDSCS